MLYVLVVLKVAKMLGKQKAFARCGCAGHGSECSVSREIQSKSIGRAAEKIMTNKEIEDQLEKCDHNFWSYEYEYDEDNAGVCNICGEKK